VVIFLLYSNYLIYPQNTQKSHFHQIIHPIFLNHIPISIRSVTIGIRATEPLSLYHCYTSEFKNTRSVVTPYLFIPVSAFAKSVEPQCIAYLQGLRQRYNLLTRYTPNQCALLRRENHGSTNQLSSDKIGTGLGLTDPIAVASTTQHSDNPRLSSSGSSSRFL
jgi:hypothetical protein